MAEDRAGLLHDLVLAHRILVDQGVLDAFGHASVRDPVDPSTFWLGLAGPPSTVERSSIVRFGPDGEPLEATERPLFAERFIHSAIYRARPDVLAVCHHHSPSIMPFCIAPRPLVPVSQTGAFMAGPVPVWDSAADFGDTAMIIRSPEEAESLARTLGSGPLVLMRGHGATAVGRSLRDLVFKAIYACRDADFQRDAAALGALKPLSEGEITKAGQPANAAVERCWTHWCASLPHGYPTRHEGNIR